MSNEWPTLLTPPSIQGVFRSTPEDFQVEEIPAYPPSGEGSHLMLLLEKRERNTEDVAREIARQLGCRREDLGYAGLKDRHAVTRQWMSVPAVCAPRLETFSMDGVQILDKGFHRNKLKTGHLRGNRFRIRLRELTPHDPLQLKERLDRLSAQGVPNYFGAQRFGMAGNNAEQGKALMQGKGRPPQPRILRLLLSAVQSELFNDVLAARIRQGLFLQAIQGDLMAKEESGGIFLCAEPGVDQSRLEAKEIHPTGPLFGPQMKQPEGEILQMERQILTASGLDDASFQRYSRLTAGTRRPLRLLLGDPQLESAEDGVILAFSLPAGGYATCVLRELLIAREGSKGPR